MIPYPIFRLERPEGVLTARGEEGYANISSVLKKGTGASPQSVTTDKTLVSRGASPLFNAGGFPALGLASAPGSDTFSEHLTGYPLTAGER